MKELKLPEHRAGDWKRKTIECRPREINDIAQDNIKCPEIGIEIEGLHVRGLVDTGSPITCLCEEFFLANNKSFQACPKLAVIGHVIRGRLGQNQLN